MAFVQLTVKTFQAGCVAGVAWHLMSCGFCFVRAGKPLAHEWKYVWYTPFAFCGCCACVCVCVGGCVRACVRVCVRVCVCALFYEAQSCYSFSIKLRGLRIGVWKLLAISGIRHSHAARQQPRRVPFPSAMAKQRSESRVRAG